MPYPFRRMSVQRFQEALAHGSERIASLITFPAFAKQTGQAIVDLNSQASAAGDSERFGEAIDGSFTIVLLRENLRFDPK
jgi:hypothetical protein